MRRRRSSPLAYRASWLLPRDRWEALLEMLALTVLSCVLLAEALVVAVGLGARP
jgi:hypothetical protein